MKDLNVLMWKMDVTKVRVVAGDLPVGDWIFNGSSLVLAENPYSDAADTDQRIKMTVHLAGKCTVQARKAEEGQPLSYLTERLTPWATTVAGANLVGGVWGILGGFAAGSYFSRNEATFSCHLDDGRSFIAKSDYKLFRRIQSISKNQGPF